jgi:hypothetical protein
MIAPSWAAAVEGTGIMPAALPQKVDSSDMPALPIGFLTVLLVVLLVAIVCSVALTSFSPGIAFDALAGP